MLSPRPRCRVAPHIGVRGRIRLLLNRRDQCQLPISRALILSRQVAAGVESAKQMGVECSLTVMISGAISSPWSRSTRSPEAPSPMARPTSIPLVLVCALIACEAGPRTETLDSPVLGRVTLTDLGLPHPAPGTLPIDSLDILLSVGGVRPDPDDEFDAQNGMLDA